MLSAPGGASVTAVYLCLRQHRPVLGERVALTPLHTLVLPRTGLSTE